MYDNYIKYHDVVFMDATYKTNKHDMPLTVLSSINNEGRNVVLAYSLEKKESTETYTWILDNLLKFVDRKEPGVILTDFDPGMCAGIEKVFQNTVHLLC